MKIFKISFTIVLLALFGFAFSSCRSPGGEIPIPGAGLEEGGPSVTVEPGVEVPPGTPAVPTGPTAPTSHNLTINVLGFGAVNSVSAPYLSGSWTGLVVIPLPVGVTVELTAVAGAESFFREWSGDCSGSGSCVVTMDNNKTVQANFEMPAMAELSPTVLTVTFSGVSGGGKVSITPPMVECVADCFQSYGETSPTVHLAATPNPTYDFKGWSGACHGLLPTCDITLPRNVYTEVVANFDTAMRVVEVESDSTSTGTGRVRIYAVPPSGSSSSIVCVLPCRQTYPLNTVVTLTAVADTPASSFDYWSFGDCFPVDANPCSAVTLHTDELFRAVFKATILTPIEPFRPRVPDLGPRVKIPSTIPSSPMLPPGPGL